MTPDLALLLILFAKTDFHGVHASYKIEFPSLAECHKSIQDSKFTIPAAENETTLAFICVPKQEINREPTP